MPNVVSVHHLIVWFNRANLHQGIRVRKDTPGTGKTLVVKGENSGKEDEHGIAVTQNGRVLCWMCDTAWFHSMFSTPLL